MELNARINFSDYMRPVRCFPSAQVSLLFLFMSRYGAKTRLACTLAKAAENQWNQMLTVCNNVRVQLGCSLTSVVL